MDKELEDAISMVWRMAERKHQDECYWDDCIYCDALTKVAKAFPDMEGRVAAYLGEENEDKN